MEFKKLVKYDEFVSCGCGVPIVKIPDFSILQRYEGDIVIVIGKKVVRVDLERKRYIIENKKGRVDV